MTSSILKIDTHQHFWRYDPIDYVWISNSMIELKQDRLPQDVYPSLIKAGISGCIAVQARQSDEETEFLMTLAKQNPWILGVIGWIDLCDDNSLDKIQEAKGKSLLKGFRHIVQDEPNPSLFLENIQFNKSIKALLNEQLIYEVLIQEQDLPAAIQFCQRHHQAPLVLDHLGKPSIRNNTPSEWKKSIAAFASLDHVYCKLSGLVTEANSHWKETDILPFIEIAIETFTPSRLMFGSDWPVCLLAAEYSSVYTLIEKAIQSLSLDEQKLIWGANAQLIYRLSV